VTATQPPLFPPGWDEPCGDADERAFVDLHGPQPEPRLHDSPLWEYGRSYAHPDIQYWRDIEDVPVGRWL
jgi:hypothetical protein